MLNVYINGLSGKMGQTILHLCDTDHDLNVVTTKNLEKIDVVIDFSRPESTLNLLKEFEDHKVPFETKDHPNLSFHCLDFFQVMCQSLRF